MAAFGTLFTPIIYIQSIMWFGFIVILSYLVIKNKLTYIEQFRRRWLIGLIFYLIAVSIHIIFHYIFQFSEQFYNVLDMIILMGAVVAFLLIISGLVELSNYLSSIIDLEGIKNRRNTFIISLIPSAGIFILNLFIRGLIIEQFFLSLVLLVTSLCYFYAAIYSYYLDRELKIMKINMMVYFATGFLLNDVDQFLTIFWGYIDQGLYWVIHNSFAIIMVIFLVIGYLNFKNRIQNINKMI